jgi:SAM-dependent methyltransferase
MTPFDDPEFVERFLAKRRSPRSINNILDTPTLLDLVGNVDGKRVVEIGCNAGDFSQQLATTKLAKYAGFDISATFVSLARAKVTDSRFSFEVLNVSMGLPTVTADVVVSGLTLNFVENIARVVLTVHQILPIGGHFVFSIRHPLRTCNLLGKQNDGTWNVRDYCDEGPRTYMWHGLACVLYHRTIGTWISLLATNGFQVAVMKEPLVERSSALPEDVDHSIVPGALYFQCIKVSP